MGEKKNKWRGEALDLKIERRSANKKHVHEL